MTTTKQVLGLVKGSLLADLLEAQHEDACIYLDFDPALFGRVLTFLRLCRIATPDCPAPLPSIQPEDRSAYRRLISKLGLDTFMFGRPEERSSEGDIFGIISGGGNPDRLEDRGLVKIELSSSAGVSPAWRQEALGPIGLHGLALENQYGSFSSSLRIRFLKHRVRVEAMEFRIKRNDLARMSDSWDFLHGDACIPMSHHFAHFTTTTGRLVVPSGADAFVDKVEWRFPRDFCIEHVVLHGLVLEAA